MVGNISKLIPYLQKMHKVSVIKTIQLMMMWKIFTVFPANQM